MAVHPHIRGAYSATTSANGLPTVHPHIRGAYNDHCAFTGIDAGSSPPTWGILASLGGQSLALRFIPTYVGHTQKRMPARGLTIGSSPPTWGIPSPCTRTSNHSRFIPTYVGHTPLRTVRENFITVHPHIRGAYLRPHTSRYSGIGSSPHTWGIPSCPQWSSPCSAVHPHIRGAYMGRPAKIYVKNGSSPHTWGIRLVRPVSVQDVRFIPTYVGHTK